LLLPIARWQGYGGITDRQGTSFETVTWATGLLAGTRDIVTFATVHVPLVNPVFAAKAVVSADHIGSGRFGLNVVSGWNVGEFKMFGAELRDHDERYAYSEEWLGVVKRIWSEAEPFDHHGTYFRLEGVVGKPKPWKGGRPLLMSAGSSPAGRAFAARRADCLFMVIVDKATLAGQTYAQMHQYADFLPKELYIASSAWPRHGRVKLDPAVEAAKAEFYDAFAVAHLVPDSASVQSWDPTRVVIAALRGLPPDPTAEQLRDHLSHLKVVGVNGPYDFEKAPQRGLSEDAVVVTRWSPKDSDFEIVSQPRGIPIAGAD
jgi:hypothetical protein